MGGAPRSYRLLGERERAAVRDALEEVLAAWNAGWLPSSAAGDLSVRPAAGAGEPLCGSGGWRRAATADGRWVALAFGEGGEHALAAAICAADPELAPRSALGEALASEALDELLAAALGAPAPGALKLARGAQAMPDTHSFAAGSAACLAELRIGAGHIVMVASAAWTLGVLQRRLPARAAPARLAERREGIASQPLELQVLLGSAELGIASLGRLEVGDVIFLDTRVEQPLTVAGAGGRELCAARLGSRESRKAVVLSPLGT